MKIAKSLIGLVSRKMPPRDGKFVPVVAVSYTGTGVHSRQLAVRKLVSRRAEQEVAVSHSGTGVKFF